MAPTTRVVTVILCSLVWSWLGTITVSYGAQSDIHCLRSIKGSFKDPLHRLNSWNFNNDTKDFICSFVGIECWHHDENKVININLSNKGLKGQFPRDIDTCTTITGLNLSSNHLSGPIPSDISKRLPYVSVLDLSNNSFSGEIPVSIANCYYLNVLKLNNNQLSGQIPLELSLLNRLRILNVANNLLSGPVPKFFSASFGVDSYANNLGLCGGPLDSCSPKKSHALFISGFVVGYVVAIVFVLVAVSIIFCKLKLPGKKKMTKKNKSSGRQRPTASKRSKDMKISTLERVVFRMSFTELSQATNDFSNGNIIGTGNMGTVYKAMLSNGWFLAVKRLHDYQQFKRQFVCEVMTLGRLRHTNLVPLLGFSIERKERLLVYKYMSNGSLHDQLHQVQDGAEIMEWPQRVKIAIGIARGLAWLHHCCDIRVVHLNLCSKCILLDQKFEPKISNFGGSLFMNPNETCSDGSFIMSSEFWDLGFVKKDVHSFGIVLFELITGKDPDQVENSSASTHLSSSSSGFYDAVDKSLIGQGFDGEIFHFLRVASNCVQAFPDQRPTMLEVYKTLREVGERYGLADDSEMLTQGHMVPANTRDGYIRVETTESL